MQTRPETQEGKKSTLSKHVLESGTGTCLPHFI